MPLGTRSPATVAQMLHGVSFPATREQLIDYARGRNAAPDTLDFMGGLPDERYASMADVFKGIGRIVRRRPPA